VVVGLRPEHLELANGSRNGKPLPRAPVALAEPVGAQVIVHLELAESGSAFCACLDSRTTFDRGELLTLAVDPARLHFFDPETEAALS
jgi:multiple sugar transport system ATP-binding protein